MRAGLLATAVTLGLVIAGGTAQAQQGDPAAGKEKAAACAQCHGADGNSPAPTFPILAGQHADYLVRALEDYGSGVRRNQIMAGFASGLNAQDRADLAAWFASQESGLTAIELEP